VIEVDGAVVYHGSNLDVLPTLPDNSVDSIVTDPPYELGFMGKSWDNSGIAYSVELWTECLRVLKPGGHLLAFGGSRTWHRLVVAIEDAGFEMRDSIAWLYGSGFPKSHDVAKAINKVAGVEYKAKPASGVGFMNASDDGYNTTLNQLEQVGESTPQALKWQGWGTALKPAFEPVVVARKPFAKGDTVAANVLQWGTGGFNIDASRIPHGGEISNSKYAGYGSGYESANHANRKYGKGLGGVISEPNSQGRWPANIILDPYTADLLDEQSGVSKGKVGMTQQSSSRGLYLGGHSEGDTQINDGIADSGGASRFFYVAKASKRDRNEGLEALPLIKGGSLSGGKDKRSDKTNQPVKQNFHPTVKPTALMEYLIKLVTPAGGTVLDPFAGSGSTGKAALLNGFQFIGIELTAEYLPIIEGRLRWATENKENKLF
jgi:site-specific DNA-methyltransferase (adenine-specific)